MKNNDTESLIPEERVAQCIIILRGEKVILDFHLAAFYQVDNKNLKQAVRRNLERFPEDFMFKLSNQEISLLVSQNVIPSKSHLGGSKPFAFTESGVAMLASILKSPMAISTSIGIIRTFTQLRKMSLNYEELKARIDNIEDEFGRKFRILFQALEGMNEPDTERKRIGFK